MSAHAQSFPTRNVGEIAATVPGATRIFRMFDIDFCCHGDMSVAEAAAGRGLHVDDVELALESLDPSGAPEAPQDTDALIAHIQSRYHDTHRRELPELIALSRKVEAVHSGNPDVPAGLADTLAKLQGEMEVHMKKEELLIFPAMRGQAKRPFMVPIDLLRHDHEDQGAYIQQIIEITGGFSLPSGACRSWQALYAGVIKFKDDVMDHVHLENNILFPRFENPTGESAA